MGGIWLVEHDHPMPIADLLRPYGAYRSALADEMKDIATVLDIGCGTDSPVGLLSPRPPSITAIDLYGPSIDASRAAGLADEYVQMDALDIADHFGPNSFDAVTALDIIEHFEKPDGYRLLEAMETVARTKVVVFTPNGFVPQNEYHGNQQQVHLAGWHVDDFELRGYRVRGMAGWRPLVGDIGGPKVRPRKVGWALMNASQVVVDRRPKYAFDLLAVRDL